MLFSAANLSLDDDFAATTRQEEAAGRLRRNPIYLNPAQLLPHVLEKSAAARVKRRKKINPRYACLLFPPSILWLKWCKEE